MSLLGLPMYKLNLWCMIVPPLGSHGRLWGFAPWPPMTACGRHNYTHSGTVQSQETAQRHVEYAILCSICCICCIHNMCCSFFLFVVFVVFIVFVGYLPTAHLSDMYFNKYAIQSCFIVLFFYLFICLLTHKYLQALQGTF